MAVMRGMELPPQLWYDARQNVYTRGTNRRVEEAP
jgi:hypothetical protein